MEGISDYQTQIIQKTVALDPKFNDVFIPAHEGCKCGGDVVKGNTQSGYAVNYRECIKCRKNWFVNDSGWKILAYSRIMRKK